MKAYWVVPPTFTHTLCKLAMIILLPQFFTTISPQYFRQRNSLKMIKTGFFFMWRETEEHPCVQFSYIYIRVGKIHLKIHLLVKNNFILHLWIENKMPPNLTPLNFDPALILVRGWTRGANNKCGKPEFKGRFFKKPSKNFL